MPYSKEHIPWNKGNKVLVERICEFCGGTFQISQAQAKRMEHHTGRFCSKECFYAFKVNHSLREQIKPLYQRGKTVREIGAELKISPFTVSSQISRMKIKDRFGDGVYSSVSRRGLKHLLVKQGIVSCELCDYQRTTEIAHIIERKNGGEFLFNNCILLCPNCHYLFDNNLLTESEKNKLKHIARLNGNLARRLKCQ